MATLNADQLFDQAVKELRERFNEARRQKSDVLFGVSINLKQGAVQEIRNPIEFRLKPVAA